MVYIYGSPKGPIASSGNAICITCGHFPCTCINFIPPCPTCSSSPCVCSLSLILPDGFEWIDENTLPVKPTKDYPHVCPNCGEPAYVGFNKVDCMFKCKG